MYKRNDNETVFIEYIICPGKVGVVAVHALGPTGVAQLAHIIALPTGSAGLTMVQVVHLNRGL